MTRDGWPSTAGPGRASALATTMFFTVPTRLRWVASVAADEGTTGQVCLEIGDQPFLTRSLIYTTDGPQVEIDEQIDLPPLTPPVLVSVVANVMDGPGCVYAETWALEAR